MEQLGDRGDNPGVTLPSTPISICRRSDSSGTTQNFSEFLVKGAPGVWTLGSSSTISWPAKAAAATVTAAWRRCIKSTSGAVGYVDYADAEASKLVFASVKNSRRQLRHALSGVGHLRRRQRHYRAQSDVQRDLGARRWLLPDHLPVVGLVYETQSSSTTAANLKAYIGYLLGDGQKRSPN